MRTTLTIDDQLMRTLKELAHRTRTPFKVLIDRVLRAGLTNLQQPSKRRYRTPTFSMGRPGVDIDKAMQVAADLDDDEWRRKFDLRK